ncbi:MAG: RelA/SpoT family protein [Candidatus Neomarinimicrobiota bacterium]
MDNPIAKLAPQFFGDYPKSFLALYKKVYVPPEIDKEELKDRLWKAFSFGNRYHDGQKRRSGEPYFNHCIEVANTLASWNMDYTTIMAGLLHDVVEDTTITIEDIEKEFDKDLANLVDGLTKISGIEFGTRKEKQAENFMKMLLSVAKDIRVIIIKFADRMHNMKTITHMPRIKQRRIAIETRDVYSPLAHRLGMATVKSKLDDLSFQVLNKNEYQSIESKLKTSNRQRKKLINSYIAPITKGLGKYKMDCQIYGRSKSYFSIYGKMLNRNKDFEDIYDLYAIRIIVKKLEDCYSALGVVHSTFTPVQERFKDFIATPKTNGYQSIHTTIIGTDGKMVEIQIRTLQMDETAEIGVASHWIYKEGKKGPNDIDSDIKWLRELIDILKNESSNPKEFMDLLKIDLFDREIYVFTPAGDLIQLPAGSTPVDFAFEVHTQVGMRCLGAKVNHQLVTLNVELKSGDVIEIITGKKQTPSLNWRKFVVTSKATNAINKYIKNTRKVESMKLGKEILLKTLRRLKVYNQRQLYLDAFGNFGFNDQDSYLSSIGQGKLSFREIYNKINPSQTEESDSTYKKIGNVIENVLRPKDGIVLDGIKNLMIKYGKCCSPIPGDDVVGFVTRGRGLTVHRDNCHGLPLVTKDEDRLVDVEWNLPRGSTFNSRLKIIVMDYKGLLKDLSECIVGQNINIASVDIKVNGAVATAYFMVQIKNKRQLDRLIKKIYNVRHVDKVERVGK